MFLDGVCICLGCMYPDGPRTIFLYFLLLNYFFHSITTPNLLLLCYCQKWQVPIFVSWTSFLLLLYHFCFCLGCMDILTGPALICDVFCCLFNFFCPIITPNLLLLCYCQKLHVPSFVGWTSFLLLLYHFCFCLGCVDILTGPALISDVFCCLFNFFLPKHYS